MKKERNLVVITQSICGIDIKLETLIKKVDTWKVSHINEIQYYLAFMKNLASIGI